MTRLRPGLHAPLATVLTGGACAVAAAAVAGRAGLLAALVGTALVLAFLWSGILPLLVAGRGAPPARGAATGLLVLTYTLRLALALVVLRLAAGSQALAARPLGLTVIATAAAWVAAQLWRGLRHPDPR